MASSVGRVPVRPHPPVRNAAYLRTLLFRIYLCLLRDFANQHFFYCSIYIETAQNCREECNEFADLLFWRLSLCLSRDSFSSDTRSLDRCISFKFIFLYLWYIPPHSRAFHTFYFTPIFSLRILPREIFFLSLMTLLSGIYSFDTMEFFMKHKW